MYTVLHTGPDRYSITLDTGKSVIINFKEADVGVAISTLNRAMIDLPLNKEARQHIRGMVIRDRRLFIKQRAQ
jgi:hypothetical protein